MFSNSILLCISRFVSKSPLETLKNASFNRLISLVDFLAALSIPTEPNVKIIIKTRTELIKIDIITFAATV